MLDPRVAQVRDSLHMIATDTATPPHVAQWAAAQRDLLNDVDTPMPGFAKGDPLPQSLGAAADHYADVRERRLALQKETDAVKERETELYKVILGALAESVDTGAAGHHHRVQLVKKIRNNVTDWQAFYQYVQQNGAFEMLQKRLSEGAVNEYKDTEGALPPGVTEVEVDTLSFSKVS